ncbi:ESPR-type extended signal peptide-containing protein [Phascolarctobacterium succinatutens]|uniref:ESPR-type extended signal peptide-containing protein n=3 Tax=Phascolarctobacterium succinatutens TaxID=626940 RepID=UPI00307F107A
MNKVFKVIWSEARNAYVVVSEMAKNHGAKSCSTKKLLAMLIATGVMTCASMAPAMADNPASDDANKGWNLSVNNGITAGTEVQPGGYVNFNGDEGNIIVSATKEFFGPSVQISLSRNLNVDSIHAGDYFMNNDMGIGFGGDAYITQSGLNANGKVITNVAAGTKATDAVNVGQLNSAVAESGWNLATNGVVTDLKEIKNNAIVNFEGDENIGVSKETVNGVNTVKVELNKDLKVNSVNAGDYFFDAERGVGFGGDAYVTQSGLNANGKVITNVAAGTADTDAVNVGQLNSAVAESGWKLATNGAVTSGLSEIKNNGIVNFAGDEENITVSKNDKDGITTVQVELNKDLKVNQVNAGDYFFSAERGIGFGGDAYITKNGLNANDKVITNVAEGVYNTDAVNVGQLKKVEEVAANANKGWNLSTNGVATEATQVAPGEFVDFSGDKNISVSHDGTKVQVELNKDIDVNSVQTNTVQTNALNAKYNLSVGTANENGTVPFFVNSNGAFYGANNNFSVDKDGKVTATAGEIGNVVLNNGVFTGHSALRDAELFVGDADGNYSQITPKSAKLGQVTIDEKGNIAGVNSIQTNALNAKYNLSVGTANENGIMPFFVNSNGAFYGANNNFSVDKDGKVTATAGEIGNVVLNNGVFTGHSALRDGELFVGDASGNYSQITTKGAKLGQVTIAADGKIHGVTAGTADTDAVNVSQLKAVGTTANMGWNLATNGVATEATNVKPGDFVDFSGDKNISVSHDGTKVQVELNKDIDVNYVQTNALNAKYNLSVGTANENGTVPFFVNSNGAFYGANNNFSVDKDGKVTATAGEIGNVVLQNGVYTGHSALRDAELFVGDADGNYSQITPKSAKLGQVTIDEKGNIAGVNSIQTNALNAKYNLSVGTANENGIMPFFVNSNGAFYGANNNFSVDKDGKVTATAGEIGNVVLNNGVFTGHSALRDGELFVGDASGNYSQITTKGAKLGKVTIAADGKISGVAAGAVTADSTDAVNGSQLHAVATEASKHSKVVGGNNINVEETDVDGQKFYKVNMNKDIILGDLTGKYVNISGTNGTIETTGYIATKDRVYADKGGKLADIDVTGNKISNGASSIVMDGSNVKVNDKVTIDQNGKISGVAAGEISKTSTDAINGSQLNQTNENVAALDKRVTANEEAIKQNADKINKLDNRVTKNEKDIAANRTDIDKNKADIKNLDNRVTNVEELAKKHTTVTAGDNITVTEDTNKDGGKEYKVALKEEIKLGSETTGQTVMNKDGLKVGDKVSVTKDAVTAGKTSISDEGVKVGDKTYISDKGLNANDQKVTNVAAGEISATSKDAVNGSQLYATNQEVANNTNRINQLGSRVNKVGAGAAALAALHPMDFDPDDKLTFSAGYGNYGGENAAAIGAYYRPDEKVMFSVGGTVGNGENMVNAGVSFSLDRTNHVSNSRTAMAREILDLRAEVTELKAMVAKGGLGSIAEDKMKIFPDVAENHWAYEYVGKLAAAGIIEGYPDGNFSGDRMMSRYEFAAMLYRAMQKGAQLDSKIINEFAPEMGRIRVDRISGEDGDRDKIERVRVNAVKGERDHYGNKIAKAEAKAK